MKRSLIITIVLVLLGICINYGSFGQSTSPTDYFRSKSSGAWNSVNSWESSADGATNWGPSTLVPSDVANTITVGSGHTIAINTNATIDQVNISAGGVLELATTASTSLIINDGAGSDITIENNGIFKHNLTGSQLPTFRGLASMEIQSGGILEVANNNGSTSNYATTANVIWADNSIFNWNNTSSPTSGITYFPATAAIPIFRFSLPASIGGTGATVINGLLEANADVTFKSTGTKTIRNGITGPASVTASSGSVGQFIINGTIAKLGGGVLVLPDAGLLISTGTEVSLISNKTINKFGTAGAINVSGSLIASDYIIDGSSTVQINGTVKTSNANGLSGDINTTFAAGCNISSIGNSSLVEYNRAGDQTVTPLSYANLNIYGSGYKKVIGASDIGVTSILNIASFNTLVLNGTNLLNLGSSSTLNINANSTFDNGGESRIKGGGTINIYGTFITRSAAGFSGATSSTIQGASSVINIYDGSVVEFGRAGDQIVTSRDDFRNITFSGNGIKTVPTMVPFGTVIIKDNAIVDASNKTFGNETTNLTMISGRFRVAGLSTKPDIAGTYNLLGGVIEFAGGSTSSRQNIRSTPIYVNIEVPGINVGNSSSSTKLASNGSFIVKSGGSYENSGDKIDGTTGLQTFVMEAGSTFKTGVTGGFSGTSTSALYNIENITIDPKSTIIYSRAGDQTITPLSNCPALFLKGSGSKTVASGTLHLAETADSLVIDALVFLKVNAGAKADFNHRPVIIHSNVNGSGAVGEIADGAIALLNATNVTVERFIPAKRAFRLLTSPVTTTKSIKSNWMEGQNNPPPAYSTNNNNYPGYGTHITGSPNANDGFDPTATNNPSVFTYNNIKQEWEVLANTNSTMTTGYSYRIMIRGGRDIDLSNNAAIPSNTILRATGSLQTGTIVYDKNSFPSISPTAGDYSLIGNPYASAINWDMLAKSNLSGYYYVWDPNLNTRGAYAIYGNGTTNPRGSMVNQHIQPGQAFFVQTSSSDPSLTFNESNKTIVNRNVFRTSSSSSLSIQLLLDTVDVANKTADGVALMFDSSYSRKIESEDAIKFYNQDENMSIIHNRTLLSIEGRPSVVSEDSIQLHFSQLRQKSYYLKFYPNMFSRDVSIVLKDNFLNTETPIDINSETILPFGITSDSGSFYPTRFIIIMKPAKVLPITIGELKACKKENGIELEWVVQNETDSARYEVEKSSDGKDFEKKGTIDATESRISSVNYKWFDNNVSGSKNFYRIKGVTKFGANRYSNVVLIKENELKKFAIFPNPVIGSVFYLRTKGIEKGNYAISLYNSIGEKTYSTVIYNDNNSEAVKISINRIVPKGNYIVEINNVNKTYYETIVFY